MHDRTGVGAVQARQIGRRMNLVADFAQAEQLPLPIGGGVGEPIDLMWFGRHQQHAGALPFGVEPERLDIGLHAIEVLPAHRLERVNLVGPARLSVLQAVRQAGVDEAAVAARRRPADPVGLDQDDAAIRISLGGMQCGPQPGVSAADHQQVADRSIRLPAGNRAAGCRATSSRRCLPQAHVRPGRDRRGHQTPSPHRGHYGVHADRGANRSPSPRGCTCIAPRLGASGADRTSVRETIAGALARGAGAPAVAFAVWLRRHACDPRTCRTS